MVEVDNNLLVVVVRIVLDLVVAAIRDADWVVEKRREPVREVEVEVNLLVVVARFEFEMIVEKLEEIPV